MIDVHKLVRTIAVFLCGTSVMIPAGIAMNLKYHFYIVSHH